MKRILILISIICYGLTSIAQETKSQLVTRFDVIRNETAVGGNTKTRIANAYQELSDGMIGVYPIEATGTDTYSGSLVGIDGYNKRIFFVTFQNNNTGASTLNINSIGAVAIQKDVSGTWTALSSGDIIAGKLYRLFHDGTRFQIDLGGAGGSFVESVSGQSVDNTDPANPVVNAWPLGGTEPTGFSSNVVIPGNGFNVTLGQSGDRAGDFRIWSSGTARIDGTTAAGIQSDGPVDMTGGAGNLVISSSGHIFTDGNVTKKGIQTAASGYVTDPRSYTDKEYVDAADALKTSLAWTDNEQTTNYTAALTDINKVVQMNSASALNFTVPPNASVAFPIGTYLIVRQKGAGTVTIVPGSGVTVTQPAGGSMDTPGQGLSVTLHKTGTNTWDLENGSAGSGGGGSVNSVSGTTNRVTSTGGADPVIDISATFEALLGKVANPLSQFAATTSAQLRGVISDESGGGNAYFQGGDLGTPSAGVLTNATGLPVSTGLANASGGTRIIGRASGTSGAFNEIVATSDNTVLNRSGGSLTFSTIGNAHISDLAWSKLTGTPTTISGYGITDAASIYLTPNHQTASYTLAATDAAKLVEMNVASSNTLTVPPNSSVSIPVNTVIHAVQYGAGTTTIVAGSGVTLHASAVVLTAPSQWAIMTLKKIATDEWYVWNGSPPLSIPTFLSATSTLDFGSTAAGAVSDLTLTVTGASVGDVVTLGVPNGSVPASGTFFGWVSSSNTVTVRYANNDLTVARDPASGSFTVKVLH